MTQCVTNWKGKIKRAHISKIALIISIPILRRQAICEPLQLRLAIFSFALPALLVFHNQAAYLPILLDQGSIGRNGDKTPRSFYDPAHGTIQCI